MSVLSWTTTSSTPFWSSVITRTLYLAILPRSQRLLSYLAELYIDANREIKRTVLRTLETPILNDMTKQEIHAASPKLAIIFSMSAAATNAMVR